MAETRRCSRLKAGATYGALLLRFSSFSNIQTQCLDEVGTELANDVAAEVEAVQAAAQWLKDNASVDAKVTVQGAEWGT